MTTLTPDAYEHLKAMALRVYSQTPSPTMSATELLHEAWLKVEQSDSAVNDRHHYIAVAARAMRQILIDRARARGAQKRGGDRVQTTLTRKGEAPMVIDLLALDDLLTQLEQVSARAARVVELKVFGGLSSDEIAEALGVSRRTVFVDWRFARAFLEDRLREGD
ncbi:MAG: sigma-70 family RNA polymerase sigma factor [Alphaproteobacteria bacterium]|nr:sigma-70 family RNA polymerase sigma factor [Alphaproteobacteria bacterium]